MGELLICLACMFLPVLAFGLVDQRQWPREEQNREETPSYQSAFLRGFGNGTAQT